MFIAAFACTALASFVGPEPNPAAFRAGAAKALPLLAKGASGHAEQKSCFACHNQAAPMIAFAASRGQPFAAADDLIHEQAQHIHDFLTQHKDEFRAGKGTGGQADTAGWALYTLDLAGWKADDSTAAVVEYLLKRDADRGYWRCSSNRPPTEASSFTTTDLAVRALKTWGSPEQQVRIAKRTEAARAWLIKTKTKDTEDRVFRLRGLQASGSSADLVRAAADELLADQRSDGGWAQLVTMSSDPYATAIVLAAFTETHTAAVDSPAFRHGLAYLLRTQRPDGSWFLKSRSKPFQPYYESGFPHKKDQFISIAATGWAAAVLTAAVLAAEKPTQKTKP